MAGGLRGASGGGSRHSGRWRVKAGEVRWRGRYGRRMTTDGGGECLPQLANGDGGRLVGGAGGGAIACGGRGGCPIHGTWTAHAVAPNLACVLVKSLIYFLC